MTLLIFGQVGIGTNVVDNSAILEVSNTSNQGVLLPIVYLGNEVSDTEFPILNPVDGMMVYNQGGPQIPGYYYWSDGIWRLLADNYNNITDLVLLGKNVNETLFSNVPNNQYVEIGSVFEVFSNNIKLSNYNSTGNVITLPAGYYSIQLDVEFSIPNITADVLQTGSGINLYKMKAQLFNSAGSPLGPESIGNSTLNKKNEKNGSFIFDFKLTCNTTTDVIIKLAPTSGGTYSLGVGGSGANDGSINVINYKIHIQKSILL